MSEERKARFDVGLSVVLPAYNEAPNVEATLRRAYAALGELVARHEIILVDDGSRDETVAVAESLRGEIPTLKIIRNPINFGVGTSILIGFRSATMELVLHDAMDYPFELRDLERVLPLFPAADAVAVVREDRSAHSAWRTLTSLVHYWLVRILFRVPFGDMNFVQVYKKGLLDAVTVRARSPAFVTPELLIRCRDRGYRVDEVRAPFHPRERGVASYGRVRDILWTLGDACSFWLERTRGG